MSFKDLGDSAGCAGTLRHRARPSLLSAHRRRHHPSSSHRIRTPQLLSPRPPTRRSNAHLPQPCTAKSALATVPRSGRPLTPPPCRRTGGSPRPAYLITAAAGLPVMARPHVTCPFCGGRPVKKRPWLAGAQIGASAGGLGASLLLASPREAYLKCHGCMIKYIDTRRDARTLLRGLHVERRATFQVRCYYVSEN